MAFLRGIHRSPVNSPAVRPLTRKMFPFDDVIMDSLHYRPQRCWRLSVHLLCGDSLVTGEFPAKRQLTRSCDVSLICAWMGPNSRKRLKWRWRSVIPITYTFHFQYQWRYICQLRTMMTFCSQCMCQFIYLSQNWPTINVTILFLCAEWVVAALSDPFVFWICFQIINISGVAFS